jgi:inorganic triphosphatase YgiF
MTTMTREVERKYALPEGTALPPLDGLPGVTAVSDPETFTLEAIYYDTSGLGLARHRTTLRRRTGGTDAGWHLKLPAAQGRDEIHAPLGSAGEPPEDR